MNDIDTYEDFKAAIVKNAIEAFNEGYKLGQDAAGKEYDGRPNC